MQPKKSFALIKYDICDPKICDPEEGRCVCVPACTHKVIKQLDGAFEHPMVFQDMCMGCWDCIEACPLDAVFVKNIS